MCSNIGINDSILSKFVSYHSCCQQSSYCQLLKTECDCQNLSLTLSVRSVVRCQSEKEAGHLLYAVTIFLCC